MRCGYYSRRAPSLTISGTRSTVEAWLKTFASAGEDIMSAKRLTGQVAAVHTAVWQEPVPGDQSADWGVDATTFVSLTDDTCHLHASVPVEPL